MKNKKFYWKLVRVDRDISNTKFVSSAANGNLQVVYEIGRTSLPPVGKLFLFKTRADARQYKLFSINRILKVKATNVTEIPVGSFFPSLTRNSRDVKKFWRQPFIYNGQWLPTGTVLAGSITPVSMA